VYVCCAGDDGREAVNYISDFDDDDDDIDDCLWSDTEFDVDDPDPDADAEPEPVMVGRRAHLQTSVRRKTTTEITQVQRNKIGMKRVQERTR